MVKQHRNWKPIHNPKLIVLERYKYQGPFHSKEWSAILGGGDFTVVEEAYEDVTPNYFQEEPE